jgi:hypothetical protein
MAWDAFEHDGRKGFIGDPPKEDFTLALIKTPSPMRSAFAGSPGCMSCSTRSDQYWEPHQRSLFATPSLYRRSNSSRSISGITTFPASTSKECAASHADPTNPGRYIVSRRDDGADVLEVHVLQPQGLGLLCEYEILDPALTDADARQLIITTLLKDLCGNRYSKQSEAIQFVNRTSGSRWGTA